MTLSRTLLRFLFLAAIGHQVTYTIVEGGIFDGMRRRVSSIDPRLDEFIHCHLCVGTWAGALLAAIYRPNLLAGVDDRRASAARGVANLAGDAVLIALGTRLWNEMLGLLRREVEVKQREIDAPLVQSRVDSALVENERVMMPGISIRS